MNIIAEQRLAPFAGSQLSETEIARQLGAGSALVLRSAERQPSRLRHEGSSSCATIPT